MEIIGKFVSWSWYCDKCESDVFLNEFNPVCARCYSDRRWHVLRSETQWIMFPSPGSSGKRIFSKVVA